MPIKKEKVKKILSVVLGVVLVFSVALSILLLFNKFYYTPFWVNGQSMYPTLNGEAKYSNGTLIGEYNSHGEETNIYDVDYGMMDEHQKAIDNIKRFDIVICKYNSSQASYNIKRVLALPGETFYINNTDNNGSLYVLNKESQEFELIEQPLDKSLVANGEYFDKNATATTLKDNEYFVVGDNRKHGLSYDSRKVGPITKDLILGVAKYICGKAKIGINDQGIYGPIDIKYHFPRFI